MAANNPQVAKVVAFGLTLFGTVPALVGLGLLASAVFTGNRQFTILNKWPTTEAEVVRSELAHHPFTFRHDSRPTTVYQALVDFHYTVGGRDYTATTGTHYSSSNYKEMKGKVDRFASGSHHPIRYNPDNPNDMREDAGYTFGFFITPVLLGAFGLPALGFGLLFIAMGRRVGKSQLHCPSCGAGVARGDAYCPACGTTLPTPIS